MIKKLTIILLLLFVSIYHPSHADTSAVYVVKLYEDTVFVFTNSFGATRPEDRAKHISRNINILYENRNFQSDSINLIEDNTFTGIWYGQDFPVFAVFDFDVPDSINRNEYAKTVCARLVSIIEKQREQHRPELLIERLFSLLLVLFILFFLIKITGWFFKKLRYLAKQKIDSWSITRFNFLSVGRQLFIIQKLLNVLRWVVLFFIVSFSLPFIFNIFPETQIVTQKLINWILSPAKDMGKAILLYLPNVFTIAIIWIVINSLINLLRFFANEIKAGKIQIPGFYAEWANTTFNLLRFILYVFFVIMIFPYLPGSNSPAFQGISVFLGLMLSLGSSSAITNIIAGIVLTYMRPFKIGERIKIGEISGDVIEKTMLNTRLLTPKQEEITIPNSSILSNSIINYSAQKEKDGVIVHTSITIGYDTPWKDIHSAMIEAARRTEGIERSPEPFVLQRALNDFYVEYQVNGFTKVAKRMEQLYSDMHQNIQDVFNERGLEIMSPHYQAHRDGSHTTIPKQYLPVDYTPEGIRINNKNN